LKVHERCNTREMNLRNEEFHDVHTAPTIIIVTCIPIARHRLGKHILAQAYARDNRTSTARQRCGKHASSTIKNVFRVVRAEGL
jgi:hypothetical protein